MIYLAYRLGCTIGSRNGPTVMGVDRVQHLSVVQDYILKVILHHRVVKPLGESGTVWAGVDFTRDVSVLSDEHDVVRDLYRALEDWLLLALQRGDQVPMIDGIDLTTEDAQALVAWHETHRRETDPDQAWFWTPEWQAGERAASRQIQEGQGVVYESDEDFLAAFDGNQN